MFQNFPDFLLIPSRKLDRFLFPMPPGRGSAFIGFFLNEGRGKRGSGLRRRDAPEEIELGDDGQEQDGQAKQIRGPEADILGRNPPEDRS
jgi:hypothetical protein